MNGSLSPTPETKRLARAMCGIAQEHDALTATFMLDELQPGQVPALVMLLLMRTRKGGAPVKRLTPEQIAERDRASRGLGRPRKPLLLSEEERRRQHARWNAGARDDAARAGEREYQRAIKRVERVAS